MKRSKRPWFAPRTGGYSATQPVSPKPPPPSVSASCDCERLQGVIDGMVRERNALVDMYNASQAENAELRKDVEYFQEWAEGNGARLTEALKKIERLRAGSRPLIGHCRCERCTKWRELAEMPTVDEDKGLKKGDV